MKVYFKKVNSEPLCELYTYSSVNPIPFTLKLKRYDFLPETIYTRNMVGENFIEFRFIKETKQLYEITLVAIEEDTVKSGRDDNQLNTEDLFECYIDDCSELDISKPMQISRAKKTLYFFWGELSSKTYPISEICGLGVDEHNNLCSLSLVGLNEELIFDILGF